MLYSYVAENTMSEVILFPLPCIAVQIRTDRLLILFFTSSIEREVFVIAAKPPPLAASNNRTKCITYVVYNAAIRITVNQLRCRFALQDRKSHS
jgi:hypothetical protein